MDGHVRARPPSPVVAEQALRREPRSADRRPCRVYVGLGVVYSGLPVSDAAKGSLPIVVDIGGRFSPRFYAGFYGQFAHVFVATNPV